ncbi:hypothetical protein AGMMS4957_09590 [Bacteroidia bacterium]|nr:hypothetical protein AGMMS4957_09590 [Bacteroidia bacterium]
MRKGSVLVLFLLTILTSCQNKIDKEIKPLIEKDSEIDTRDWESLTVYLENNKASNRSFFKDDLIDADKVQSYISSMGSKMRPPLEVRFSTSQVSSEALSVRFYLERSGSMVPYDAPQCTGIFKSAIVDLLNHFPNGDNPQNLIYIVNNAVYPYPTNFTSFIKDKNIFQTTRGIGDPQYTDFAAIFDSILANSRNNQLSILVSDMIYSTKDMKNVNPQKTFNEAKGLTSAIFKPYILEKSALIIRMDADFHGNYYSYDSPSGGKHYSGNRPYYFFVVGDNNVIERIYSDAAYRSFSKFETLKGFEHLYCFAPNGSGTISYYSILPSYTSNRGTFKPARDGRDVQNQIRAISDIVADRASEKFQFAVAIDLSKIIVEEAYKTNPDNYKIQSLDNFTIESITAVSSADITPNNKRYMDKASHIMLLKTDKVKQEQKITVSLLNKFPEWIVQSSSDDDRNTSAPDFATTTFGFQYLMQGIYDAYYSSNEAYYTNFEITLKH